MTTVRPERPAGSGVDDEAVDHLFVAEQWHCYANAVPFFRALPRRRKFFFSDVGQPEPGWHALRELVRFRPERRRGILYVTMGSQLRYFGLRRFYRHWKTIRVFHGIVMPWARILSAPDRLDVALTAGDIDTAVWRQRRPHQRTVAVGWPLGEAFLRSWTPGPADPSALAINSSWARTRSALAICDQFDQLADFRITFLLHSFLQVDRPNPRRVGPAYVRRQLAKVPPNVRLTSCPAGALPHLRSASLLLGTRSSSTVEWLVFDRPALLLRPSPALNFGPLLDRRRALRPQVIGARDHERPEYRERRQILRQRLLSHADGQWRERFLAVVFELEADLAREPD